MRLVLLGGLPIGLALQHLLGLDPALVEPSVAYYAPLFLPESGRWGEQETAVWTAFADFLTTSGVASTPVDGADAFTNDHLPQ